VAEQPIPLVPMLADVLILGSLIASRDAARVALGRLHVCAAPVEPALIGLFCAGALSRPSIKRVAPRFTAAHPHVTFAVRHFSSSGSKLAFSPAYHVTTE
jgi:hypothetical protein